MGNQPSNRKNIRGDAGITAGGDVSIEDVTGQLAIGNYINQFKIEKPSGEALVELMDFLDRKRQESVNVEILNSYTPSALPDYPPRLRKFVTENRVDELTQALISLQDHRILLVSGIGGVGKTTLARALVEARPANVPLPFWFDFSKKMDATLRDVLEKLASYMNTPDIANFKEEGREAGQGDINRLTGELQKREPVWLVFDNLGIILDGMHFHDPGIDSLFASLRGSTHQAKIIVTSRILPILGDGESLIDVIEEEKQELKGLKTNFAVDYLIKNGLDRVEREKLEELAIGADGHPLALRLLIELVKGFGVADTLNDLSMYQRRKEDTIKKARRLFDKLAGDEKELLERISVYRQPESMTAIKKMFTDKTPVDAMKKLIDKSLLETDHKGTYWLHPLVKEFAYDDLGNKIETHKVALQYYLALHLPEKRTKKEDVQPLIEAHYQACMAQEYDKAASIIIDYELYQDLEMWGNYRTLVELFTGVLSKDHFRDKPLLSDMVVHSNILACLGIAYYALGDARKAFEYYEIVLKFAQKIGNRQAEGVLLGNIGMAFQALGDARKAIEYYEKALKIAQEIGNKEAEGMWLGNFGNAYRDLSDAGKAIGYYEKALKIAQEIEDRQAEGTWLGSLGNAYRDLSNARKALEYYEKALKIAQEIGDRRNEGAWLGDIGMAFQALGDVRKANEYYEKALKIAQEIGDRRNEGMWLGNFGNAYRDLSDARKAIGYYEKALKIAQEIGDRQAEGSWLGSLGYIYRNLGDVRKAIEYYEKALKIAQEIGNRRIESAGLNNLGVAFEYLEKYDLALACYLLARKICKEIRDPEIKATENNIKELKTKIGEKNFQKLMDTVEQKAKEIIQGILGS